MGGLASGEATAPPDGNVVPGGMVTRCCADALARGSDATAAASSHPATERWRAEKEPMLIRKAVNLSMMPRRGAAKKGGRHEVVEATRRRAMSRTASHS